MIKEVDDLKALDFTTLFDKLEEHEQELTYLEKTWKIAWEEGKEGER